MTDIEIEEKHSIDVTDLPKSLPQTVILTVLLLP